MQWHYAKQGRIVGPVEEEELRRLARQGEIGPDDLIWNPTLGEKWAPASSVENLFDAPPGVPARPPMPVSFPSPGSGEESGLTPNRDLMRLARESLRTHWGLGVGISFLYLAISFSLSLIPLVGSLVSFIIDGSLLVGFYLVFLNLARRQEANAGQFFKGFELFATALGANFLMTVFVLLWSLLLIIPGAIAFYSYAMVYFILADDPTVGPLEAITRSKEMMRGKKWKLLCLHCRFFGWALLCILTLGIGFLWLGPYMQTAMAHFYDDVHAGGSDAGFPSANR